MYEGWISEREEIEEKCGVPSVLNNYPAPVGQEVTSAIIRSLVQSEKSDFFKSAKDLEWTMDVICYGLSMPMADGKVEMVKNCVYLYHTWSSVLSNHPLTGIPPQIVDNKEFYFTKILQHLTNLFIPRDCQSTDLQVNFCTKILNHINSIVQEGNVRKHIAEDILRFYLGISGHLLSFPPMQGGLAERLCEKLINCLIQVWLHITCDHFPSPTLWRTLNEMLLSWRHHAVLITQWYQLMHLLTCRLLDILFGPGYSSNYELGAKYQEPIMLPPNLPNEIVVQCWFRFLHIIGNPVDLSKVDELTRTEYFMKYKRMHNNGTVLEHPCLKSLPESFYGAMKGVSSLIDMFLGVSVTKDNKRTCSISSQPFNRRDWRSSSTGAMHRKYGGSGSGDDKSPSLPGGRKMSSEHLKRTFDDNYVQAKNLCNSTDVMSADANCILHMFGAWLFDVCLSGVQIDQVLHSVGMVSCGIPLKSLQLTKEEKERLGTNFPQVLRNEFEPGRAQAFITLCNIFCHPRIKGQSVLPVYLSRFYLSVTVGLCYGETRAGQVLGSILMNATDIFRLDLQGVQVLVPHFLQALEIVLPAPDNELQLGYYVDKKLLRRSCIQILLSMLCLPLHFLTLPIQGLCREKVTSSSDGGGCLPQLTFLSLRRRIAKLLTNAIEAENDALNTQMLLGGMMMIIEDNMCMERNNYESGVGPTTPTPNVTLDQVEASMMGSPKLIHLAKIGTAGGKPVAVSDKRSVRGKEEKGETTGDSEYGEDDRKPIQQIGCWGSKDDILTTQGEFVYLTSLIQHNMMFTAKWKSDLRLSLSSLECLAGLATLDSMFINAPAARKTVKWICDYIYSQAIQPPQFHSKDLHSQIVAAFNCISMWLSHHPWLMDNLQCLEAVLEVIELGISGRKSKKTNGEENAILKRDKESQPTSSRVRAAAQALLALMMENLGYFPTPSGPASICSMLDEDDILSRGDGDKKMHYYALDGSVIIGLKEDRVEELPGQLPSLIAIIRGATGKKVCILQMRHFSRANQHISDNYKVEPERPSPLQVLPEPPKVSQEHFPEEAKRVERSRCNDSIPQLNNILDEKQQEVQEHMEALMGVQASQESAHQQQRNEAFDGLSKKEEDITQHQPTPLENYDVARLFLSHMGFLRLENISLTQQKPAGLQYLDNSCNNLETALKSLDTLSTRTYDTMYIFFVKKGQYEAQEIIENKIPTLDNQLFMEFVHSLGWSVDLTSHTGWNGDVTTSWRVNKAPPGKQHKQQQHQRMFYYSDLLTEIAIHVPVLNNNNVASYKSPSSSSEEENGISTPPPSDEKVGSDDETSSQQQQQEQQQQEVDGVPPSATEPQPLSTMAASKPPTPAPPPPAADPVFTEQKHKPHTSSSETKIVVVWLQDITDADRFPLLDMVELYDPDKHCYSSGDRVDSRVPEKEVVAIFIHPLKSGLFHIHMRSAFKSHIAGPLVDNMIVSRRTLGSFVRHTAINTCRRRRLEVDNYSHPHVCRKMKIQEIVRNHAQEYSIPNFYSSLFDR